MARTERTASGATMPRAHTARGADARPHGVAPPRTGRTPRAAALSRPPVTFLAWAEDAGRANEIAHALGGEVYALYRLGIVWRPLVPLRYVLNTVSTCRYLLVRRPRAVIVTNPPIFPGLIALLYCTVARVPLVLDSHPSAFGVAPLAERMAGVHAWLTRRAASTIVTVPELERTVASWGGRADIVHEAPPAHRAVPAGPISGRPRILYIGRFAGDEPTAEVIEAARLVPEADVLITGDTRKCPPQLSRSAPENVTFTGFLHGRDYDRALEQADAILVLTRHPLAVNRGACEAVYFERPLIISDLPAMTPLFPYAVAVSNDAAGIAQGIRSVIRRHAELVAACPEARSLQEQRWEQQLHRLREVVSC